MSLVRLLHTVRHLRARQVRGQLVHRVRRAWEDPAAFARRPAPAYPGCRWRPRGDFLAPGARFRADALRAGRFAFLNETRDLGWPPRWEPEAPLLWRYNLHYFEYLFDVDFAEARACARDWIVRHPIARGRPAWDPYPTSLRIQNWCLLFFGRHRAATEADAELRDLLWTSLYRQAEWLDRHLETHLLGNHLLENAAALALAGACFAGPAAERWRRRGLRLLEEELAEQILPDGCHFEASPMYHARAVWLLLALRETGDSDLRARVEAPLERALAALPKLCHPDGRIALLSDSAFGIQNEPADLLAHAAGLLGREPPAPPAGAFALPDVGYFGARSAAGHHAVCDAGPIGPDAQPGHAHADLFSFELSLRGRRVVSDAGVYGYEADAMRRYCRSTAAHNTVEIDGEDQCEMWAAFRVGRRGLPRDVRFEPEAGGAGFRLAGWHDGYRRLPGRPVHFRELRFHAEAGVLLARDRVRAGRPVRCVSRLHLHPDCRIEETDAAGARVAHPGGRLRVAFAGPGALRVELWHYCPEFGRRVEGRALAFEATGSEVQTAFCIADGDEALSLDPESGARRADGSLPF